ncbi:hypothetical protein VF04_02635 [Nostoc linckia z7]|uniref:Uncharacterized protein n=2 Tax=Nostoc linckia TaxID=92942 RepID=A0A9Q6EJA8_NOSLI|nr:hypothetical protein VF03_31980 [Nostoc linckia z2]PHJ65733.1 hypothetical protein VF02_10145 [Nostoc linckia z1]PHJ70526.1 hypothetical protein VF05_10540 [Nostoc linckia z3]PHJ86716.1 hypothetical protein VF07_21470 [Nostoc linckia z6]PHJ99270.1 hypothetical protein VF08_25765 [Nostoc linckia z8]PHK00497.1 hypothetical protein VF04_02635 [Nostoc linckia z7]PHK17394.1 hypothetical protein VF11_21985 [Nostoc linckia z14]PHK43791.1 hypothetical protein VF13_25140 [Nostoc linckia z16]
MTQGVWGMGRGNEGDRKVGRWGDGGDKGDKGDKRERLLPCLPCLPCPLPIPNAQCPMPNTQSLYIK